MDLFTVTSGKLYFSLNDLESIMNLLMSLYLSSARGLCFYKKKKKTIKIRHSKRSTGSWDTSVLGVN